MNFLSLAATDVIETNLTVGEIRQRLLQYVDPEGGMFLTRRSIIVKPDTGATNFWVGEVDVNSFKLTHKFVNRQIWPAVEGHIEPGSATRSLIRLKFKAPTYYKVLLAFYPIIFVVFLVPLIITVESIGPSFITFFVTTLVLAYIASALFLQYNIRRMYRFMVSELEGVAQP